MSAPLSLALKHVFREAEDIARHSGQRATTAHLLLGLLSFGNPAGRMLERREVEFDRLIKQLREAGTEPAGLLADVEGRCRRAAETFRWPEADCLHLLSVLVRDPTTVAHRALTVYGVPMATLRRKVTAYLVDGKVPRHLGVAEVPAGVPGAGPERARSAQRRAERGQGAAAGRVAQRRSAPATTVAEAPSAPIRVVVAPGPEEPSGEDACEDTAFALDPDRFPLLAGLGRNLTQEAAEGKIDPLVAREAEVHQIVDILNKRRANNPCLVGPPGVGKTAIVEGLARAVALDPGSVPGLAGRVLVAIEPGALFAGTALRGSLTERIRELRAEVADAAGRVVVFLDELHALLGQGGDGSDAASDLKTALARGEFPCIGATTEEEYRLRVEADPALARRFVEVHVAEPTPEVALRILEGLRGRYEAHHGVRYEAEALEAAVRLSHRFLSGRFLPDKALHLVDLAAARGRRQGKAVVDRATVAEVAAGELRVPVERLLMSDAERLLRMESEMAERIVGHPQVVERLARVVRRNQAGFSARRPIGSFLFLGPTGVGKTETAKVLADYLFTTRDALCQVDMSEYGEPHAVARLIGAPPGYVGHEAGGQLSEAVRRRPYQVVLLDEVEKAHPDVLKVLLQVLDEGRLTDGRGRVVDFCNTIVVMTSNLGSDRFSSRRRAVGFGSADEVAAAQQVEGDVLEEARRHFAPELWNRIEERLVFSPLTRADVCQVARLLIAESSRRLEKERGIAFEADEAALEHLIVSGGWSRDLGARPMRQTIQRLVEGPLAEGILRGDFVAGDRVLVHGTGDGLSLEATGA